MRVSDSLSACFLFFYRKNSPSQTVVLPAASVAVKWIRCFRRSGFVSNRWTNRLRIGRRSQGIHRPSIWSVPEATPEKLSVTVNLNDSARARSLFFVNRGRMCGGRVSATATSQPVLRVRAVTVRPVQVPPMEAIFGFLACSSPASCEVGACAGFRCVASPSLLCAAVCRHPKSVRPATAPRCPAGCRYWVCPRCRDDSGRLRKALLPGYWLSAVVRVLWNCCGRGRRMRAVESACAWNDSDCPRMLNVSVERFPQSSSASIWMTRTWPESVRMMPCSRRTG